jgi:integrase
MEERGVDPSTAEVYRRMVRLAYDAPDPPTGRVRDRSAAPKTRRLTAVSLAAWAEFKNDAKLAKAVNRLRKNLPRAVPLEALEPLSKAEWRKLERALEDDEGIPPDVRAVIAIMAIRGLRVGDVLRMERRALARGVKDGVMRIQLKKELRLDVVVTKPLKPWFELLLAQPGWETVADLVAPASSKHRTTVARNRVERWLKTAGDRLGIEGLYPHRLRRTVATAFYAAAKGDIVALMQYMGWTSMQTAYGYINHDQREKVE